MILVTGGTGLVGSHLLYYLTKHNDNVIATYRKKEKLPQVKQVFSFYSNTFKEQFGKIEWIQADITDIPSLKKVFAKEISQVYHCAALVSFNPKHYRKMRTVNIEGTANLMNFCIDYGVKKVCFTSSIAAIGNSVNDKLITEENEWNEGMENSEYAITKFGAEMEVWRASQEGVSVVVVNPGVILGSGFYKSSGMLFHQAFNEFKFYTEGVTGFVGVEDVVKIMIELMQSAIKNERFIIVAENKSFKEVLYLIADAFGKRRPSIKIHPFVTEVLWRANWLIKKLFGKPPLLTKHSARAFHATFRYSSDKIKKTVGYSFTTIEEVIEDVCKHYS